MRFKPDPEFRVIAYLIFILVALPVLYQVYCIVFHVPVDNK